MCVHDNLRSLELIKQYCEEEKIKGLLVGVDARKAFDSVYHEYMQEVSKKLWSWTQIHKLGQKTEQKPHSRNHGEWVHNRENIVGTILGILM